MSHPDKYAVGLLSLGMMFLSLVIGIVVLVVAFLHAHRVLPRRRSRLVFWLGMAVMVPLPLISFPLAPELMHALAVIGSFGWEAYENGLRVVSKHGELSDGRFLSVFWSAAMGIGILVLDFCWLIPITVWYCHFNPRPEPRTESASGVGPPQPQ